MNKNGRPKLSPGMKRTGRVYVYCRLQDQGPALRECLRRARDAYERRTPVPAAG
jgi:hypothetical protein